MIKALETVYYRCQKCNFVHQVPSYWTGHHPEATILVEHLDLQKKEICEHTELELEKE